MTKDQIIVVSFAKDLIVIIDYKLIIRCPFHLTNAICVLRF